MTRFFYVSILLSLLVCVGEASPAPSEKNPPPFLVGLKDGVCMIEAHDAPLQLVVKAIRDECGVTLSGLETRRGERVTIAPVTGTRERVVKALLHVLGENNYLLQFAEDELIKAAVLSSSKASSAAPQTQERKGPVTMPGPSSGTRPAPASPPTPPLPARATVVAVRGIIAGSQAEDVGLKDGDVIVQYGGARVESASQLIHQVKEKSSEESVEMLVLRDGRPMQFTLQGGQIGVQIHTIIVPEEDLKEALPEEIPKDRPKTPPLLRTF